MYENVPKKCFRYHKDIWALYVYLNRAAPFFKFSFTHQTTMPCFSLKDKFGILDKKKLKNYYFKFCQFEIFFHKYLLSIDYVPYTVPRQGETIQGRCPPGSFSIKEDRQMTPNLDTWYVEGPGTENREL